MTTHELAKKLLEMPDVPATYHIESMGGPSGPFELGAVKDEDLKVGEYCRAPDRTWVRGPHLILR